MRRLFVVGLLFVSACGSVPANPSAPSPEVAVEPLTPTSLLVVPGPGELPAGGGTARVWIEVTSGSRPAAGTVVSLRVTAGDLERTEVAMDRTGHATVNWNLAQTATVIATVGDLTASDTLKVAEPFVPPVSPPFTPAPTPPAPPPPAPPPPPVDPATILGVTLTPTSAAIPAGTPQVYTATVANLQAGETIVAYQWEFETGATATTTTNTRSFAYTTHGIKTPRVSIVSSSGRTAGGSGSVVVTSPLR